jgi:hypothetical protein
MALISTTICTSGKDHLNGHVHLWQGRYTFRPIPILLAPSATQHFHSSNILSDHDTHLRGLILLGFMFRTTIRQLLEPRAASRGLLAAVSPA